MIIDVIALFLVAGIVFLGLFFFTKGPSDPSEDTAFEEKVYDAKKGINKFNL